MLTDPAAHGRAIHDHEDRHHCLRPPAARRRHERSHPCLAVDPHEEALEVEHAGLDLDDQQDAGGGVDGEEVDAASLTEMIEGDLREHQPAKALEAALPDLAQPRVIGVQKAGEVAAMSPNLQVDDRAKRCNNLAQGIQLVEADAAGFESGDDRLGDASLRRQVNLAPASPMAQRPEDPADDFVAHPTIVSPTD